MRATLRALMIAAALAPMLVPRIADAQSPAREVAKPGLTITLLGTAGGPPPHAGRSQPANLLQVDGRSYLIDAGENVGQQLLRAGMPSARLDAAFISHLHWDHVLGLGYLMATGWMTNRNATLPIWGPPGLAEYVTREEAAVGVGEDIFRAQSPDRPPLQSLYAAHEADLSAPTEIYKDDKVRVTAVPNSHFAVVHGAPHSYGADKSYSYRFDTAYGSVVFTGDTGPSDAVAKLATGADILVTEICDVDSIRKALEQTSGPGAKIDALMMHMQQQHLNPEEVGKLATKAGVKKIVLTHYVIGRDFDPKDFVEKVRAYYPQGEIVVGQDLLKIGIRQQ